MLIRVKYAKRKKLRYISHLELMNTLRRALRRAQVPVAYSKGFNPHQLLALSQPLAVGMTGEGEYFDLQLEEELEPSLFVARTNEKLPPGLELLTAREVKTKTKSLMAVINRAIYDINLELDLSSGEEEKMLKEFLAQKEIMVLRKRRQKEDKLINIRNFIHDIQLLRPSVWRFTVSTGSEANLRPEELIKGLAQYFDEIQEVPLINVVREGLYVQMGEKLLEPLAEQVIGS